MPEEGIALAQSSIMQRLAIAHLTWRRYLQKRLKPYGITLKQAFVLEQLEARQGLLPSRIADMLFCDRPTATVIIKNMEKQGWVERRRGQEDRRQRRVLITPRGRAKLAEIREGGWRHLEPSVDPLACFDRQERGELDRLLAKLIQHLGQLGAEGP